MANARTAQILEFARSWVACRRIQSRVLLDFVKAVEARHASLPYASGGWQTRSQDVMCLLSGRVLPFCLLSKVHI